MPKTCIKKSQFLFPARSSQNQTHPEVDRRQFGLICFSPSNWPPLSPNLNLLDYFAYEFTLAKLGCTIHTILVKFTKIRDKMPQKQVRDKELIIRNDVDKERGNIKWF
jgi:hypothetical protein